VIETRKQSWFKVYAYLLVLCLSFLPSVFAQREAVQRETESAVPERETKAAERAERMAQAAKARRALETKEKVTFEDIMKDPDNIDLNFQFAKSQVADGDILGASATLERILMVNPDLTRVRLFYAIVLFRLDNWNEAEVEFNRVREVQMPDSLKSEINAYLKQIRLRRKRTRFTIRETFGYQHDDNRNAAPSSKRRLLGDISLNLPRSQGNKTDLALINLTHFDVTHDLGFQQGHEVFATFDYFLSEQTEVDSLDLSSYQWSAGTVLKFLGINITPAFFMNNILLSRETFLRQQGGSLNLERDFFNNNKVKLFASGRLTRQDFSDITENLAAHERQGDQLDATVGVSVAVMDTMRIILHYLYVDKDAKEEYNAYTRNGVELSHMWLLGKGQFLMNTLNFSHDNYEAPDLAISGKNRRDKGLRYRVTYGAPLEFLLIGKILPKPFKDITLTVTYEYYRALTNITNYTFTNNKFQGLLTKTFEF